MTTLVARMGMEVEDKEEEKRGWFLT